MFFNRGMVKSIVVLPYHGILFSNKKKPTVDTHNLDKVPENHGKIKVKKSQS